MLLTESENVSSERIAGSGVSRAALREEEEGRGGGGELRRGVGEGERLC